MCSPSLTLEGGCDTRSQSLDLEVSEVDDVGSEGEGAILPLTAGQGNQCSPKVVLLL